MRRAPAQKRKVEPDPVFRSALVSQVINKVLLKGKKDVARSIAPSGRPWCDLTDSRRSPRKEIVARGTSNTRAASRVTRSNASSGGVSRRA